MSPSVPEPWARTGLLLIVASPSGAGKSTLSAKLRASDPTLAMSVSVTTRPRRPTEVDGVDYAFAKESQFVAMRDAGDLLEWAQVHGNYYGTPREPVEEAVAAGRDILFDIDYQGTRQLVDYARRPGNEALRDALVRVFILPPSANELRARLIRRADTPKDAIGRRLANARIEIQNWTLYDYVIVNDDIDASFQTLQSILVAERARRSSKSAVAAFVNRLDRQLSALPEVMKPG